MLGLAFRHAPISRWLVLCSYQVRLPIRRVLDPLIHAGFGVVQVSWSYKNARFYPMSIFFL